MSILKVAHMGHPGAAGARAGRSIRREIRSPAIQRLIDDMFETMREYQGVGLAAPQVHEGLRLFVAGFAGRRGRGTTRTRARAADGADQPGDHAGWRRGRRRLGRLPEHPRHSRTGCRARRQIVVRAFDRHGKRIELRASGFHRPRHPARNRSPRRRPVLRSDEVVRDVDLPGRFGRYWSGQDVQAE